MNIIQTIDMKKTFGKKEAAVQALKGVSISAAEGEMLAIMGKSGSGKSTLLNILGGLMSMDSGEYLYKEKPLDFTKMKNLIKFRRDCVGFVVQYFALIDDVNVFENVALPLRYQKYSRKQVRDKVNRVLEMLEIRDKAKAYPDELSGGQQQRVSIARALVKNPEIILADEPTGALDEATGDTVLDLFQTLNQSGRTILIVTHDEKVADKCHRIIRLKDGLVTE